MPAPPELSATELGAWTGFLRAHAAILGALDRELRERHDLSLASYEALMLLAGASEHRLRMSELAEAALASPSGTTRLVERLEREGLVERVRCEEDQRGYYAVLRDAGMRAFKQARPTHLDGVRRLFLEALGEPDQRRMGELWRGLLERSGDQASGAQDQSSSPQAGRAAADSVWRPKRLRS